MIRRTLADQWLNVRAQRLPDWFALALWFAFIAFVIWAVAG